MKLDRIDRLILGKLQQDGKVPSTALAGLCGIHQSGVHRRIKRLERCGVIRGYVAVVEPDAVDRGYLSFILCNGGAGESDQLAGEGHFLATLRTHPFVQEIHTVSGRHQYLIKVRSPNGQALRDLQRLILRSPWIKEVELLIGLETIVESGELDLESEATVRRLRSGNLSARKVG